MTQETIAPPARAVPVVVRAPRRRWWRDPWRKPRILQTVTWAYLIWSLVPLTIAIAISFNGSRSNSVLHGFSLQWWWSDPEDSLWHDPELHAALFQSLRLGLLTVLISVPLGVAFALGIDRWHGRPATGATFLMLLSFVLPEIVLGISLFLVFQHLLKFIELGTTAQILGLVTYQISYPFIIVRARLLTIGREYEEAATDLGAPPRQAIRRVLPPLLNDFVALLKDTGLISVLGAVDAIRAAQIESSRTFNYTPYVVAAVLFLILTVPLTRWTDHVLQRALARQHAQGNA